MKWEDRLKKISKFSTVEDFWAYVSGCLFSLADHSRLYNNIKLPSQLNITCDYNVFKEEIQPMWEVPENSKGGRWLINV